MFPFTRDPFWVPFLTHTHTHTQVTAVCIKVTAEGVDGLSEFSFKTTVGKPLREMMSAWCKHHDVPLQEAAFLLGQRIIKGEDSLLSLGCDVGTEVVIHAVPAESHADEPEPEPEKPGHSAPKRQKRQRCEESDSETKAETGPGRGKETADSKRMSFREYLEYDREEEKQRTQARQERQQRTLVNGDSSDEEMQLAMALSLSESQATDTQA